MSRPIRSYVLRQGRITAAQERALRELFPRYGLNFSGKEFSPEKTFNREAPLVLEIGSGMGETTAAIAKANPEVDFLAVEVHAPGVGALLNRIESERLTNLRVIRHDAAEVLQAMIPDASLAAIHLFFPDPWPKKRHHKRRLVQPAFAALCARKLARGGLFHAATDWPDYAIQIDAVFSGNSDFEIVNESKGERTVTKFEKRGLRLGHSVRDLRFRRRETAPAAR